MTELTKIIYEILDGIEGALEVEPKQLGKNVRAILKERNIEVDKDSKVSKAMNYWKSKQQKTSKRKQRKDIKESNSKIEKDEMKSLGKIEQVLEGSFEKQKQDTPELEDHDIEITLEEQIDQVVEKKIEEKFIELAPPWKEDKQTTFEEAHYPAQKLTESDVEKILDLVSGKQEQVQSYHPIDKVPVGSVKDSEVLSFKINKQLKKEFLEEIELHNLNQRQALHNAISGYIKNLQMIRGKIEKVKES